LPYPATVKPSFVSAVAVAFAIPVRLVEFSTDTDTLAGRGSTAAVAVGVGHGVVADACPSSRCSTRHQTSVVRSVRPTRRIRAGSGRRFVGLAMTRCPPS